MAVPSLTSLKSTFLQIVGLLAQNWENSEALLESTAAPTLNAPKTNSNKAVNTGKRNFTFLFFIIKVGRRKGILLCITIGCQIRHFS